MRIDDGNTPASLNILDDHITKQGRFTGAGLSDYINMSTAIFVGDIHRFCLSTENTFANLDSFIWKIIWRRGFF